ncbi:MAG: hypothetical protein ACLFQ8_01110 [Candidatus Aenigmatarchaeota archaeon]
MDKHGLKTLFLGLFLTSVLLSAPSLAADVEYTDNIVDSDDCAASENTSVLGLQKETGYGSHVWTPDPEKVDTDYKVCFPEYYGKKEGSFEYGFADTCSDLSGDGWTRVLDVHELSRVDGKRGSHVAEPTFYDSGGEFCVKHTGLMNVVSVASDTSECPNKFCYHVVSLAKESNSHAGENGWGEHEVWLDVKEDIDEYELNTKITNPGDYCQDCVEDSECAISFDPEGESIPCPSGDYYECYRYSEYTQDDNGNWVTTEVELEGETYSEEWGFGEWSGDIDTGCSGDAKSCDSITDDSQCLDQEECYWDMGSCSGTATECDDFDDQSNCENQMGCSWAGDAGANPTYVEMTKDREITAEFVDVDEPELDVDFELPGDKEVGEWVSWTEVTVTAEDGYSGLNEIRLLWENRNDEGKSQVQEVYDNFDECSENQKTYNMSDPGNWSLTVSATDNEGNTVYNETEPHLIDGEAPENTTIDYNTTEFGSKNITSKRNVTFYANASDDISGIENISIEVSSDDADYYRNKVCEVSGKEDTTCYLTEDGQPFGDQDYVEYNATAFDVAGQSSTSEGSLQICGISQVRIGSDIVSEDTCGERDEDKGYMRIRTEECQEGQKAGIKAETVGECPSLFLETEAENDFDSSVNDEINEGIVHPEAEDPVVGSCEVKYGGGADEDIMDGIYSEVRGDFSDGDVIAETWKVDNIPYYCRGEKVNAQGYTLYENENNDDSPVASPEEGDVIARGSVNGSVTFDPTIKKMEFGVVPEKNIQTGLREYVYPMNVTNWNDGPVATRFSWDPIDPVLSQGWLYEFARSFDTEEKSVGNTSYDNMLGFDYDRSPTGLYDAESRDLQLVLGGRSERDEDKNMEEFALVVETPFGAEPGPYFSNVRMTRNESVLSPQP